MEYVGYKKIHRHNTRTTKLTIVEWPGGGVTLSLLGRVTKGVWSGASMGMTDATAKRVIAILSGVYGRRKR